MISENLVDINQVSALHILCSLTMELTQNKAIPCSAAFISTPHLRDRRPLYINTLGHPNPVCSTRRILPAVAANKKCSCKVCSKLPLPANYVVGQDPAPASIANPSAIQAPAPTAQIVGPRPGDRPLPSRSRAESTRELNDFLTIGWQEDETVKKLLIGFTR